MNTLKDAVVNHPFFGGRKRGAQGVVRRLQAARNQLVAVQLEPALEG